MKSFPRVYSIVVSSVELRDRAEKFENPPNILQQELFRHIVNAE